MRDATIDRLPSMCKTTPSTVMRWQAFQSLWQAEPRLAAFGFFMVFLIIPTLLAWAVDRRTFHEAPVWQKPLHFELALAVYALTLAVYARWLPARMLASRAYRAYSMVVVAAMTVEIVWIGLAASADTASHFNESSAIMSALYAFMGVSAVVLTSATLVYGLAIGRNPGTELPPVLKTALVTGLVLTFALTLVTAGTMSSMGSHLVGGNTSDAEAMRLFGWARDGGDMRVAHFFATHAMHAIPIIGVLSLAAVGPAHRGSVFAFAALYVAFVGFVFMQALFGRPFLPWIQ